MMKSLIRFLLVIALASLPFLKQIYAQCCAAGNPVSSDLNNSILAKNILRASISFKHSESGKYYKKDAPVDIEFMGDAYFDYSELSLTYGALHRLNIKGNLGYFYSKTEKYNFGNLPDSEGFGLGDLSLQARYLIYKNFVKKWELSVGIGAKLPIGVFDQERDNVKLPINVQPSSGSYKYFGNIFFSKNFSKKMGIYSFCSVELADRIESENFNYKYGDLILLSIGGNYKVFNGFGAGLQLRNEYRSKSSREDEQIVEASGGYILYCSPSISYAVHKDFFLSTDLNLPIYGYYNDIQRANKYSINFRLSKSIDFSRKSKVD